MSVMRLPFAADIAIVGFGLNTKKNRKKSMPKKEVFTFASPLWLRARWSLAVMVGLPSGLS